jgi:hypothetical protein
MRQSINPIICVNDGTSYEDYINNLCQNEYCIGEIEYSDRLCSFGNAEFIKRNKIEWYHDWMNKLLCRELLNQESWD